MIYDFRGLYMEEVYISELTKQFLDRERTSLRRMWDFLIIIISTLIILS